MCNSLAILNRKYIFLFYVKLQTSLMSDLNLNFIFKMYIKSQPNSGNPWKMMWPSNIVNNWTSFFYKTLNVSHILGATLIFFIIFAIIQGLLIQINENLVP